MPITLTSCGVKGPEGLREVRSFEIASNHKIKSKSMIAMSHIIDAYNRSLDSLGAKGGQDLLKAELRTYNNLADTVITNLKIKNFNSLPSLLLNYPNLISKIASYDKVLELKDDNLVGVKPAFKLFEKDIQGLLSGKS